MRIRRKVYPFVPKSTSKLKPGQFWAVPLRHGKFACGRVLQVGFKGNPSKTRSFFGCLLDWIGTCPPSENAIAGSLPFRFGVMHVKAITETGGEVLGERALEADGIEIPTLLSEMGGPATQILHGADPVRPARKEEWGGYPVLGYWGYDYIQKLAETLQEKG